LGTGGGGGVFEPHPLNRSNSSARTA
jgi:hypothetical protein